MSSVSVLLSKKKSSFELSSSGISPALIRWAFETMREFSSCLKIFVRYVVGTVSLCKMSLRTLPAPTDGSWSLSPTRISLQSRGKALRSECMRRQSTIDTSSTITTPYGRGSCSLYLKLTFRPTNSSSKRRCIVFASTPVLSESLFAARPVGATSAIVFPICLRMDMTHFIIVVFPVPGPPVMIETGFLTDISIARFCSS